MSDEHGDETLDGKDNDGNDNSKSSHTEQKIVKELCYSIEEMTVESTYGLKHIRLKAL